MAKVFSPPSSARKICGGIGEAVHANQNRKVLYAPPILADLSCLKAWMVPRFDQNENYSRSSGEVFF